jgi:hypothetical protein
MKRKGVFVFLLLFFFLLFLYLFFSKIFAFLAYDRAVDPDILIVEGWVPEESIDRAQAEFLASGYRFIITTGFPFDKGYTMGSAGALRFTIKKPIESNDSIVDVTLTASGTKAYHEYPHFRLFADSVLIGESYTDSKIRDFSFLCTPHYYPSIITVDFDNDTYSRFHDRNLIVYSVRVNDLKYNVNNTNVAYGKSSGGPFVELHGTNALETAARLRRKGIPDSLIIPLSSVQKSKSKTYTNASDVYQWIMKHPDFNVHTVTVLTSGIHSRRTYTSYRKAIKDRSIAVGVISCYDRDINETTWWKSGKGIKEVLYETIGYLYVRFVI